jgi:hypothetical protein
LRSQDSARLGRRAGRQGLENRRRAVAWWGIIDRTQTKALQANDLRQSIGMIWHHGTDWLQGPHFPPGLV